VKGSEEKSLKEVRGEGRKEREREREREDEGGKHTTTLS